jgi:hypothetical protein
MKTGRLERVRTEIRGLVGAALFFVVASCLVVLTDKLLVLGSGIETASFAAAIIAGLIIAKVMLIVDLLPFVDAFPNKPLVYNIAWKAPIYVAAVLAFRYVELLIHHVLRGAGLAAASHHAARPFTHPAFWASCIWITVLFLLFLTTRELSRALGKNKMRLMFLGR